MYNHPSPSPAASIAAALAERAEDVCRRYLPQGVCAAGRVGGEIG